VPGHRLLGRSCRTHGGAAHGCQAAARVLIVSADRGVSRTYVVNGRSVAVSGSGNRVTLRGRCPSLRVGGTNNIVYADSVGSVSLSGSNNRVYWRRLYNGRRPSVTGAGTGNQVLRRRARSG
jgi:hypothetical protein